MNVSRYLILGVFVLVGLGSLPDAAAAQGRGNAANRDAVERRDRDDRDDDRYDDRYYGDERREQRSRNAGPPFCRNGQGHPVHGRQWCYDRGFGTGSSVGDIIFDDRRSDNRSLDHADYDRSHADFHRELDRRYADLASRRPLDLQYQLELRREKQAEHDRWHQRVGIRHE
ncbi:MAG TPA: hypothetical protein VMN39_01410 [Longimicrobiaceae bacterium]|nr:hypothetical protein [Longimicrobiaceae bacterium]